MSGSHTPVDERSGESPAGLGGGTIHFGSNDGGPQGTHAGVLPARRAVGEHGPEQQARCVATGSLDGSGSRRPLEMPEYRWAEKVLSSRAAS